MLNRGGVGEGEMSRILYPGLHQGRVENFLDRDSSVSKRAFGTVLVFLRI